MAEQDFLSEIRETEKQAALLIAKARDDARLRLEQAREQAARIVSQGRDEAAASQQNKLREAEAAAAAIQSDFAAVTAGDVAASQAAFETRLAQAAANLKERIVKADAHR